MSTLGNSEAKTNFPVCLLTAKRKEREKIFMNEIVSRRSVRTYSEKTVDDGVLKKLLEAARLSPSGSNKQPTILAELPIDAYDVLRKHF